MKNAILKLSWLLALGLCLAIGISAQGTKKPPATPAPGSGVGGTTGGGTGTAIGGGTGTRSGSGTGTGTVTIVAPGGGAAGTPSGVGTGSGGLGNGTPSGVSSGGATGQGTGTGTGAGTGTSTGGGTGSVVPNVQGRPLVTDTRGRCYYFTASGTKRYVARSLCSP